MKQFRLLSRTRQVTEYSCGACALQAVLSYWGRDVDETDLMKLLHTTSEEGTYPEDIVSGARALGLTQVQSMPGTVGRVPFVSMATSNPAM